MYRAARYEGYNAARQACDAPDTRCILLRNMSFRPIIDLWGSKARLAATLRQKRVTVQQWWTRDSIPSDLFPEIEAAAKADAIPGVTVAALYAARAKAKRRRAQADSPAQAGA